MDIKNIHAEWVGKHGKVVQATNENLIGIEGVVVDETKNTITFETKQGEKKVPKKGTVFAINGHKIIGDNVVVAPEERIKLKVK